MYEKSTNAIYKFDLSYEDEAKFLWKFRDEDHEILFPFYESFLDKNVAYKEMIAARSLIKSKESVFEIGNEKLVNDVCYWYSPFNFEDLVELLMIDGFTYRCIIIPNNGDLKDRKYQLHVHEHIYYQQYETRVLWIKESRANDFYDKLYHSLKSEFQIQEVEL